MHARNRETGAAIVATLERVYGRARVAAEGFDRDASGGIVHENDGSGTEVDWDSSATVERNDQRIYIDAAGDEVVESDVELYEPAQ